MIFFIGIFYYKIKIKIKKNLFFCEILIKLKNKILKQSLGQKFTNIKNI